MTDQAVAKYHRDGFELTVMAYAKPDIGNRMAFHCVNQAIAEMAIEATADYQRSREQWFFENNLVRSDYKEQHQY